MSVVNEVGFTDRTYAPAGLSVHSRIDVVRSRIGNESDLWFGVVDVRDVADLHIRAMTAADRKGQRFIALRRKGDAGPRLEAEACAGHTRASALDGPACTAYP